MYFLCIRVNQIIIATVERYPIISYPMNQSGQLNCVGKNVFGDTQFRNVNPDKSPSRLLGTNHMRYIPQANEATNTI